MSDDPAIGQLPLPKRLVELIDSGLWPRTPEESARQNLHPIVPKDRIQSFAPEQDRIYLFSPPFYTIAERMKDNRDFWSEWGALQEITPELALDIGDFGLGADAAIVLDYRQDNPSVIRLVWRKPEPNTWVRCARTFDEFAQMLGLGQ